jgi:hypothetical protein
MEYEYMLFAFDNYYPVGGINDFKCYFNYPEEIFEISKKYECLQIVRIFDLDMFEIDTTVGTKEELIKKITVAFEEFETR